MPEANFEISKQTRDGIDCIYLKGYLDAHTAPELENVINDSVSAGKNKIIVNFRDLDYISSAGLGVFMAFIEEVREKGGDIKLVEMKPRVFNVFDLLGFPVLFDITDKESVAIEKFI
jgi:anti-sigma B factor antagonist